MWHWHVYSFSFSSCQLFSCLGEKATVHITHEGRRRMEGRYGFRAWKILKIFLQFFFSASRLSATPFRAMESFARFRAGGGGRARTCGWAFLEVALYCYISSSICIYLFFCTNILFCSIFMYTTGLGCFFGAQEEWKASQVKFIVGMEFMFEGFDDTFVEIQWRLCECSIEINECYVIE